MSLFGLFRPPDVKKLEAKRDVQGLIKALGYRKRDHVRQAAAEALRKIGGPEAERALAEYQASVSAADARSAVSARPVAKAPASAERSPQPPTASRETPPPPPTGPTAYCDVCGATVQSNNLTVMPLRQMQQAVRDGFNPYQTPGIDLSRLVALGRARGISDRQLFAEWRQTLMQDTTDWKLCRHCLTAFQKVTHESHAATVAPEQVTAKAVSIEAHKSVILKRASTIGIPQEVVETNVKDFSSEQLRLLAECADNLFMVYLWSPSGTEASGVKVWPILLDDS